MNTGGPASEKTLLDEFAGQALAGLLAKPGVMTWDGVHPTAYKHATAMLAEKARREADHSEDTLGKVDHSGNVTKIDKQPDACALLRKFIHAVPEGFETSLLWGLRKEAIHLLDVVPDHSPDATKMVGLEAENKELAEALELLMSDDATEGCDEYRKEKARAILAKHKATQ